MTYTYDAENNRIAMESERHKETYVVDTASSSMSRVLTITDGSGTTTLCIYGQGLICEKTGDIYQYHYYNNLGSTMKLTDAKGGVTASFTYGAYGELLSGSTSFTRFLYNGRCGVTTDDNGLYYMRQRYYNPEIKRFVNQDVLTGSLGNSQSLNRYSYAQGNPVSYTDPFGLSPLSGEFVGATFAHLFFGLLGFVPGPIGVAANLADAVLYAFEGDYLMATASLLGAVTMGFSKIATKCAAQAMKAAKAADIAKQMSLLQKAQKAGFVADLTKTAGNSLYLARSYRQARQIVNKESGLAGTARPGEAYSWEEKLALIEAMAACALSSCGIASGITGAGRAANGLRALNGAGANAAMADIADGVCFVAGTRIMTAEGGKNIEEIQTGDLVYSKNAETGETGYKKVVRLFQKETTELTHLEAGGVSITTTPTHPFWVDGYGFKAAGELAEGDLVEDSAGNLHPVTRIWKEHLDEPVIVYNFEVEDWHTYYVSEAEVFVHNMCTPLEGATINKANSNGGTKTDFYVTADGTIIPAKKVKANSLYDRPEVEVRLGRAMRPQNVTDDWDSFLGPNQTDIDPRTGHKSLDRIWSADGTRSIRFGDHEMDGMGTKNFHYHRETWYDDYVYNEVQRIQPR